MNNNNKKRLWKIIYSYLGMKNSIPKYKVDLRFLKFVIFDFFYGIQLNFGIMKKILTSMN